MKYFLNLLGLAALVLLGYGLGRWSQSVQTPSIPPQISNPEKTAKSDTATRGQGTNADARLTTAAETPFDDIPAALRNLGAYAPLELLQTLFQRWAEKDPAAACAFFKEFGIPDRNAKELGKILMEAWTKLDPSSAAAFALQEVDSPETIFDLGQLEQALAAHDPANAFQLGLTRLIGLEHVFAAWAKKDFAAASAALTQIPPGARQEQAAHALLDQAMETDPAAALAWFREQPDSVRASVGMFKLLDKYKEAPPQIYFTMLGEQLLNFGHTDDTSTALRAARKPDPDGKALLKLNNSIEGHLGERLSQWAGSDSQGALTWAQQFPDPTLRPVLIGQWAQSMLKQGKTDAAQSALQDLPAPLQAEILRKSTESPPK